MNVTWGTFTRPDGTTYRQIEVSESSDWRLFNQIASVLEKGVKGQWISKLDGLDQRYWDLEAYPGKITLHLEHYIGITVHPSDGAQAGPDSLAVLENAYHVLTDYEPT